MVAPVDFVTSYTLQVNVSQVFLETSYIFPQDDVMSKSSKDRRSNLRDVALAANVSVATVSRVLNAPERVSQSTRERVESFIEKLDFVPSPAAIAINSGRSRILGALIPTLESDIFARTMNAIENTIAGMGYSLVVATTNDDPRIEAEKARELLKIGVEGLFLTGVTRDHDFLSLIRRRLIPSVVLSFYDPGYPLPTISYDNFDVGRKSANYLAELGCESIAFISGPIHNNDRTRARWSGVQCVPNVKTVTHIETTLSINGGAEACLKLIKRRSLPDAILCATDFLAHGVMHELQRNGVDVPKEISVMGLHNLPGSDVIVPRLTTVNLPEKLMGNLSAKALVEWLDTGNPPDHILLDTEILERDSSRPEKFQDNKSLKA